MAMAVLRSPDCLGGRFRDESLTMTTPFRSRRKPSFPIVSPNSNSFRSRRRRTPAGFRSAQKDRDLCRSRHEAVVEKARASNLVMGQVKILKRGEALSLGPAEISRGVGEKGDGGDVDLGLGSTSRLGPDPETVKKQVRVSNRKVVAGGGGGGGGGGYGDFDGLYAGSGAFFSSPPPSSVPLPAFLGKNDAATSGLRRLLQLDLAYK